MMQQEQQKQRANEEASKEIVAVAPQHQFGGGYHSYMVGSVRFDVNTRYSLVGQIGQGAYGTVCSAYDNILGIKVAIKKIPNAFANPKDAKRLLREIRLLRHFRHPNIIALKAIIQPPNGDDDVYIVLELMETDLFQIMESGQPLSLEHTQYFLYQMLVALKHIHSAGVLHRDLKPSNLLVNRDCILKVCDLGLARVENLTSDGFMTEYVATRWYRAPEVILSWKQYTKAIDVWSVGCIFAELIGRKVLFRGRNYLHQIECITDVVGTPSDDDLCNCSDAGRGYVASLGSKPRVALSRHFPEASPLALDLLTRMLEFNPDKRITVQEALEHPFLATYHDPNEELECDRIFSCDFENFELTKEIFKELINREAVSLAEQK